MKVRVSVVLAAAVSLVVVASGGASAKPSKSDTARRNPYETLDIRLLSPKVAFRNLHELRFGRLAVSDATQPVDFKLAVLNTGSAALTNVVISFQPKLGALRSSPKGRTICRSGSCWMQWTINRFPGHQRRLLSISGKFDSQPKSYKTMVQATATGHLKGINGQITYQLELLVKVPAA